MSEYDCIVVGAGVIGSATAYCIARQGKRVLLIEQFFLPTTRGSSNGQSRIIRKAYNKQYYSPMLKDSYQMWEEVQRDCDEELFVNTGLLVVGRPTDKNVKERRSTMDGMNAPYDVLSSKQLKERYPTLSNYPDDYIGILDKGAGVLKASKCVTALQQLAKKYGGVIKDGTEMTGLVQGDDVTTVQTTTGDYRGRKIIITAGPWAKGILERLGLQLPITPTSVPVCYWKSKQPGAHAAMNGFPNLVHQNEEGSIYAIHSLEYKDLVKVAMHQAVPDYCDPDSRNKVVDIHEDYIRQVADYIRKFLPGLEDVPSIIEYCVYTKTPDLDFILDKHPKYNNVFIATGFSGHGFKLAPAVGKLMAEMALGRPTSYDVKPFCLSRFPMGEKKAKL